MSPHRLLVLPALLLVAACSTVGPSPSSAPTPAPTSVPSAAPSTAPSTSPSSAPSPSAQPAVLAFRFTVAGGFIGPSADLTVPPRISVYSDGTVILPPAESDATILATSRSYHLAPDALATLLAGMTATKIGQPGVSCDGGPAPDAVEFNDPLGLGPGILVRAADGTFTAFDPTCPHAGCIVGFEAASGLLVCPCHEATFDPANHGAVLSGPTLEFLAQLPIRVDAATGGILLRS